MLTDTTLEDSLWEVLQEAAGNIQVVKLPMSNGAIRPSEDYISIQMLDMIPEGNEEQLWSDGDSKFAIKQHYTVRFSIKEFGRNSKIHLTQTLLKLIKDPYYNSKLISKGIFPMGSPDIIDMTGLLSTEFESRCQARVNFSVPICILSDISCIEQVDLEGQWLNIDDTVIRNAQISVDKS